MSSYNNIERFRYTKNQSDVVSLSEYIIFDDERAQEKYAVLKLVNNLNQNLYEVQLEVSQYDEKDALVEKVVVSYKDFKAKASEMFVPKAKLKLHYYCKSISVRLVYAKFERVKYEQNEISELDRVFKDYKASLDQPKEIIVNNIVVKETKKKKKEKKFVFKDTTKRNRVKFPKVFNVIITIIMAVFIVATTLLFVGNSKKFTYNYIDYKVVSDTQVSVVGYDGFETDVTIPNTVGQYKVVGVAEEAFKGTKITSITIEAGVNIDENSFADCINLQTVTLKGNTRLVSNAFKNCPNITSIVAPYTTLVKNSFAGSSKVTNLVYGDAPYGLKLLDAFACKSMKLETVKTTMSYISNDFFANTKVNYLYVTSSCSYDEVEVRRYVSRIYNNYSV